jgi:hypothetical protein
MKEKFSQDKFNETIQESEVNPEKFQLNVGKEWGNFEKKFTEIESRIEKEEGNEEKKLKARLILKNTANAILSLAKKFVIAGSITAGVITGYTAIDFNKQMPFKDKDKAEKELKNDGIPSDQKYSAYKPGISELVYRSITPFGYQENVDEYGINPNLFKKLQDLGIPNIGMIQDIISNTLLSREYRSEELDLINQKFQKECKEKDIEFMKQHNLDRKSMKDFLENGQKELVNQYYHLDDDIIKKYSEISHKKIYAGIIDGRINKPKDSPSREDAWRIYLGLSQKNNTFSVSDFKPTKGINDKYYLKLNNFWESFKNQQITYSDEEKIEYDNSKSSKELRDDIHEMLSENNLKGKINFVNKYGGELKKVHFISTMNLNKGEKMHDVMQDQVMGNYTFGLGEDKNGSYVYYYDKWDLASKFVENPILKGVGNPYEIYDRLYYNPKTFEIINIEDNKN